MSSSFLQNLSDNLFEHEQVDWHEDKITLKIRSEGQYDPVEEVDAWAEVLSETALNVITRITFSYEKSNGEEMMSRMRETFLNKFDSLVLEQFG